MYIKSSKSLTTRKTHRKEVEPLVNTTLLKEKVKTSGYRTGWIAEQLGISRASWSYKLNGQRGFATDEVMMLCRILKINSLKERNDIFFA